MGTEGKIQCDNVPGMLNVEDNNAGIVVLNAEFLLWFAANLCFSRMDGWLAVQSD